MSRTQQEHPAIGMRARHVLDLYSAWHSRTAQRPNNRAPPSRPEGLLDSHQLARCAEQPGRRRWTVSWRWWRNAEGAQGDPAKAAAWQAGSQRSPAVGWGGEHIDVETIDEVLRACRKGRRRG